MDLELSGKRAVVTGGSRGIGLAIARALADRDANRSELAMRDHIIRSGRQHVESVFGPQPKGELR